MAHLAPVIYLLVLSLIICTQKNNSVDDEVSSSLLNFSDNPFILSNVAGNPCQKVCGAKETQLSFRTVFDKMIRKEYPSTITGKVMPAGTTLDHELELNYCYYEKMNDGWYNKECDFIQAACKKN